MPVFLAGENANPMSSVKISLVTVAGCFLLAATTGLLGRFSWLFEMASHLRLGFLVAGVIAIGIALLLRRAGFALLILLALLPHAWALRIHLPADQPAGGLPFTVLTANLLWVNPRPAEAVAWLAGQDADIVVLQEKSDIWDAHLGPLAAGYPHAVPDDPASSVDVMVFSRHPVLDVAPLSPGSRFVSGMAITLDVDGRQLLVVAVHTISPFSAGHAAARNRQLAGIAVLAMARADLPVIVVGDLNVTPYSPEFDVLGSAGLSGRAGSGTPLATWPVWLPVLGLPIDHVLGNARVAIDRVERGPDIGSDHYPVTAWLRLLDAT